MIAEILRKGERNRTTTKEIQRYFNISARDVVSQVSKERAEGKPIISSSGGGYFLPSDDPERARAELSTCINVIKSRAFNTLKATNPLRKALKELDEVEPREPVHGYQLTLEDMKTMKRKQ